MKIPTMLLVVSVSAFTCGCGTMLNVADFDDRSQPMTNAVFAELFRAPKKIYGGVSLDATFGQDLIEEGNPIFGLFVWGVDLPLSFVGDTLTLPVTIPAAVDRAVNDYYLRDGDPAGQPEEADDRLTQLP